MFMSIFDGKVILKAVLEIAEGEKNLFLVSLKSATIQDNG